MACKLTLSIVSESQKGDIGDDWKYVLEAQLFSAGLKGEGSISVPKHKLSDGATQEPPGPPEALSIDGGEAGADHKLELRLKATEVDLFKNDSGEHSVSKNLQAPAAGEADLHEEFDMSVGVVESPGQMRNSVLTLRLKITLSAG